MQYIFMAAGKGTRLHPLTLMHPKALYQLDENITILQRMINMIKKFDGNAKIIIVTGYMHSVIENEITDAEFVYNPFYEVTNSIASLWFAREYLCADEVILFNGDVVASEKLMNEIVCKPVKNPSVLLDSSIKTDGDYNVEILNDRVLVMSKDLKNYYGEYAGITRLNHYSALLLKQEIEQMIEEGFYDQWYENALVQLIFKHNFKLFFEDISGYDWTEVDSVNDLLLARKIYAREKLN